MNTTTHRGMLHVAATGGDNMQQPVPIAATSCATGTQQPPIKQPSLLEIARNKLCNKQAATPNKPGPQASLIHGTGVAADVARAELTRLVLFCGETYGFTKEEHDEALAGALRDFDNAMICFRAIEEEILSSTRSTRHYKLR